MPAKGEQYDTVLKNCLVDNRWSREKYHSQQFFAQVDVFAKCKFQTDKTQHQYGDNLEGTEKITLKCFARPGSIVLRAACCQSELCPFIRGLGICKTLSVNRQIKVFIFSHPAVVKCWVSKIEGRVRAWRVRIALSLTSYQGCSVARKKLYSKINLWCSFRWKLHDRPLLGYSLS